MLPLDQAVVVAARAYVGSGSLPLATALGWRILAAAADWGIYLVYS